MNERVSEFWGKMERVKRDVSLLREKIREGKDSLGSKLDNFLFCQLGIDQSKWKPYSDLNRQVKSSEGDEILVVRTEVKECPNMISMYGVGSGPLDVNYNVSRECAYGILSGKELDFILKEGEIIFPTGGWHVGVSVADVTNVEPDFFKFSAKKVRGRIKCGVVDLPHLYERGALSYLGVTKTFEVLVGSEVSGYFANAVCGVDCYSEIKELLS